MPSDVADLDYRFSFCQEKNGRWDKRDKILSARGLLTKKNRTQPYSAMYNYPVMSQRDCLTLIPCQLGVKSLFHYSAGFD